MRINKDQFLFIIFALVSLMAATEARADSVVYTDRNAFIAASTAASVLTFGGIAPNDGAVGFGTPGTLTLSGVTFKSGPSVELDVVNPPSFAVKFWYNTASASGGGLLVAAPLFGVPAILDITLPGTYTAIGFDTGASLSAVASVQLLDGTTLSYTLPEESNGLIAGKFFGFTTTTGITSLRLTGVLDNRPNRPRSPYFDIDDFRFGQATPITPVPEAASVVLITASGLVGLLFGRRK